MNPTEIIRKKRNGLKLNHDELDFLLNGYLNGKVSDYQMSAFLMAVYFQKMDFEETAVLTDLMLHSGEVVDLSSIPGVKVDKHSTGGVGDKVSIILAPMVAACGVPVPMISGRGLGHTGGTLDKLESIPGFRTNLSIDEYKSVISDIGLVMIGQTKEIAPADKKMYALRDVTGTVESIPLIAGSIMSKKIAEGIDALVLDVKTGRGAFMQSESDAVELAKTLIAVGNKFGKKTIGFLTDMNQPLGYSIGNWLEVVECLECLQGKNVPDLMEVTYVLGGAMLMLGGQTKSIEDGIVKCKEAIRTGQAWQKFLQLVERQYGDKSFILEPKKYPKSKSVTLVKSPVSGFINFIDALEVGFIGITLGAGRMKVDEIIDPKAGIILKKKVGDKVSAGDILAEVYTDNEKIINNANQRLERAFSISAKQPVPQSIVRLIINEKKMSHWEDRA